MVSHKILMTSEPATRKKLLRAVQLFVSDTGIPITTVGKRSCGDQSVFARIEAGGDVLSGTVDRINAYMAGVRAEKAVREGSA